MIQPLKHIVRNKPWAQSAGFVKKNLRKGTDPFNIPFHNISDIFRPNDTLDSSSLFMRYLIEESLKEDVDFAIRRISI